MRARLPRAHWRGSKSIHAPGPGPPWSGRRRGKRLHSQRECLGSKTTALNPRPEREYIYLNYESIHKPILSRSLSESVISILAECPDQPCAQEVGWIFAKMGFISLGLDDRWELVQIIKSVVYFCTTGLVLYGLPVVDRKSLNGREIGQ